MTLLDRLRPVVGPGGILTSPSELLVYECDGFTIEKNKPDVVVFPTTTEQVVQVVRVCNELNVPFLPRGAGTSLAGGCLPVGGGVMIALSRMKRILEVDYRNRFAVVEPGVVNLWLTNHLRPHGHHFAPDPSSQGACTIGGNVATNSGGPHTLKYGVTVNHVLGVEIVMPDGRVVQTGGPTEDNPGYDLTGVIVGSEGTFGVVTKAWVRITRNPEAYRTLLGVFETVDDATNTISDLIGAGIVPAALEMLDSLILQAVEAAFHFGFPLDAGAVLIMEVDGLEAGLEADAERITAVAKKNHAREVRKANTDAERLLLWKSRKQAFPKGPGAGCAELLYPGRRRRAAHQVAAHPPLHPGRRQEIRFEDLQCLSRRRRQHSPDPAVRRTRRRPGAARAGGQPRDPRRVHQRRRQRHRRARHRRREDRLHGEVVHAGRPGNDDALAVGVQPGRPMQPAQDAADGGGVHRAE